MVDGKLGLVGDAVAGVTCMFGEEPVTLSESPGV